MNKINAVRDFQSLRIYINDTLHLEIRMDNHDGVQSWYEGTKTRMYFIEFYRKTGAPIKLAYDDVNNWKIIVSLINDNI